MAYLNGRLSQVLFAKPADVSTVAAALVASKHNGGAGKKYSELTVSEVSDWNVVVAWDGNEHSDGSAAVNLIDYSGNANHLTDTNTVTSGPGPGTYPAYDMTDNNTVGSGVGPGAALSPVEDGDYFQQLLSLDSNEHAFLQPTKAKQPLVTFVDTDFNGRPSMTLSTDDLLRAAKTISTALTGTFFLAFKRGDSGADHAIFTSSDEGSATRRLEFGVDANNDHEYQQDNNDVDDVLSSGVTVGTTSPQINTWRSSGSAISLRVNAVAASLVVDGGANGGDWFGDVANRDNAVIGALLTSAGESKQLNGKIAALILYDAYLTDKECFQVEKYLQRKFAIPGA